MEKRSTARQATDDNIRWCMRFAGRVAKARLQTDSQYVVLIAFPLQEWLRERTSMLRLYVRCLSCLITV